MILRKVLFVSAALVGLTSTVGLSHNSKKSSKSEKSSKTKKSSKSKSSKQCKNGGIVDGEYCCKPKIVDHHACVTGYPDYDQEGVVCANDGDPDEEAYCSYDLGPSVCAYCKRRCPKGETMIDGVCVSKSSKQCKNGGIVDGEYCCKPKIVDHNACVKGFPDYDQEGMACFDNAGFCSYDLGPSVCAYCKRRCPKGEMMIDGECCENPVDLWNFGYSCVRGSPWYDQEGDVCAINDDDLDEHAYCSYDVGTNACAYCADNFSDTDGQLIVAQS